MKAPSVFQLKRLMELVNYVIFPDYSDVPAWTNGTEAIRAILAEQLATVTSVEQSEQVANGFVAALPEISRLLHTDADAVMHNDPAVDSMQEVILCYPVVKVMIHHRTAHWLHRQGVPIIPRVIAEMAHSATGIDIHRDKCGAIRTSGKRICSGFARDFTPAPYRCRCRDAQRPRCG